MKISKKLFLLAGTLCITSTMGIGSICAKADSASRASDTTLTKISSGIEWESGSFASNGSNLTKETNSQVIRTVASFEKQQILIEAEDGYSFKVNEVSAGSTNDSYNVNRRYSLEFVVPYNEWMHFGYFNVYPERQFTIEVRKDDGSQINASDAENIISLYKVDLQNHIPDYYKNHIKNKIEVVNNLQKNPGTSSFVFITDVHIQHNTKHSIALIKELMKGCGIKDVLGGGDWVTAWLSDADGKQGLKDDYDELTYLFKDIPLIKTPGNHDWAWGSNNQYSLTEPEMYEWFYKGDIEKTGAVKNDNGDPTTYFYKDDTENKMRYISLNVMDYEVNADANGLVRDDKNKTWYYTLSNDQIKWLKDVALKMPDDNWDCVIFSHIGVYSREESGDNCDTVALRDDVRQMLNDFKNKTGEFADYKGSLVGWLTGHMHMDNMMYLNNGSFVTVYSDGDTVCSSEPGRSRAINTVNEQSFQVVTVDKNKRKVYCTIIGAGENRSFKY